MSWNAFLLPASANVLRCEERPKCSDLDHGSTPCFRSIQLQDCHICNKFQGLYNPNLSLDDPRICFSDLVRVDPNSPTTPLKVCRKLGFRPCRRRMQKLQLHVPTSPPADRKALQPCHGIHIEDAPTELRSLPHVFPKPYAWDCQSLGDPSAKTSDGWLQIATVFLLSCEVTTECQTCVVIWAKLAG